MSHLRKILMSGMALGAITAFALAMPANAADTVTQERLLNADKEAGNWIHHHKNYSGHRFSTLNEINAASVKGLKVA